MSADTVLGSLDYPANDPRATLVLIDPSVAMTRTPTTVQLLRTYYPASLERVGYRYSLEGRTDGRTPVSGIVTLPQVEATALGAAAMAV